VVGLQKQSCWAKDGRRPPVSRPEPVVDSGEAGDLSYRASLPIQPHANPDVSLKPLEN
jgi:hypothetical protein